MAAPFRINYTIRDNTRCGHRDYGNGSLCDDCWYDNIQAADDEPEPLAVPAPRKRREAVSTCQATLF